jgi:type IV pilus assembly protein PilF
MPRPERMLPWLLVLVAVAASGCSRLSFVRPDTSRGNYKQVAPKIEVSDGGRRSSLAVRDQLLLAEQRLRAGQLDQARRHAESALGMDPRSADAHTLLAVVAQQGGDQVRAGSHYAKAAELAPQHGYALNNYGTWLCGNGRAAESLPWFERALASPGYGTPASALANAGACAARIGQDARAERDLRRALELDPVNPVALSAMAGVALRQGRALEARAFSERRLAAAPADAEALRLASQIEQKLGDRTAAERYTRQLRAEFGDAVPPSAGE